jgi:hypothetical protein
VNSNESTYEPTPRLDRVHGQASGQHLGSPAVHHRGEDGLISPKQRDIVEAQNPRNEPGKLVSHVGGRPKQAEAATPVQLTDPRRSERGIPIALRPRVIRHSDVLPALRRKGGRVVDRRHHSLSVTTSSSSHLTPESFKVIESYGNLAIRTTHADRTGPEPNSGSRTHYVSAGLFRAGQRGRIGARD